MGCFVVAEFQLTSASRGPSAIAEPLVIQSNTSRRVNIAASHTRQLQSHESADVSDDRRTNVPFLSIEVLASVQVFIRFIVST